MSDTILQIDGLVIPLRAALEFTETWTQVGTVEARRTWTGKTKILRPTFGTMWDISISGSGSATWRTPSLASIKPGDEVFLHSCKWLTDTIPLGTSQRTLQFTPEPGSVRVVDVDTDFRFPFTLAGRLVKVPAAVTKVPAILFKPVVRCFVGSVGYDADGSEGTGGWSLQLHQAEVGS